VLQPSDPVINCTVVWRCVTAWHVMSVVSLHRLKVFLAVDVNSELNIGVCCDEETDSELLYVVPSEVKHEYAPSEVHRCPLFRWGAH
jgi:hypothetical protein